MKILLINHFPLVGSGSGVYVSNIAKALVKRGYEVCIIMPENTTKISKIEKVKIHPVFFKREEKIEGQLEFNFPCMDPHPRSSFLFHNMTEEQIKKYEDVFKCAIEEEINEFKPDIIHSQHIWIISGLLRKYKIPYIITSHGAEFITYNKTDIFDQYGFDAISECEKIITISQDNKNEIINKFNISEEKLILIKNGYNSQDFFADELNKKDILKKYSIEKEFDNIVLFVGRISKMKGLDILFKAANLYEDNKTLTLLAGAGEYQKELEELKKKLNLKNVVFLGNKRPEELRELYNISNVLVLPSRKEALPLVAIEALACGTPAVVTNQFGMSDVIIKDVGLTFEMDNEKMLAEQIKLILNRKIIFDKKKITEYAKKNFSEDKLIQNLINVYEEIYSRKGSKNA